MLYCLQTGNIVHCVPRKTSIVICSTLFGLVLSGVPAHSRDIMISAGAETGYEWYDREYKRDSESVSDEVVSLTEDLTQLADDDYNRLRFTPFVTVSTISARDEVSLQYKPSFRYDLQDSEHDLDHRLQLDSLYRITHDWQLNLSEAFVSADTYDSTELADTGSELSDNDGRKQYWTNDLHLSSQYTYYEDSVFVLGYGYRVYEEDTDSTSASYDAFQRHSVDASISHRFDSSWRMSLTGEYVRGLYDEIIAAEEDSDSQSDLDLEEYRATTTLEANLIEHHPLSLSYSYLGIDYDEPARDDSLLHDVTLEWRWEYDERLTISMGAGPSYYDYDGSNGEWGYNGNLGVDYLIEKGLLRFTASKGYEWDNFTGTDENGLRDFWQTRFDFNYNLLQDLYLSAYALYRNEDIDELGELINAEAVSDDTDPVYSTVSYNRWRYTLGSVLRYSFMRWYSLSLMYTFSQQESEKLDDSFDEHRVSLMLSVQKELLNW